MTLYESINTWIHDKNPRPIKLDSMLLQQDEGQDFDVKQLALPGIYVISF